MGSQKPLLCDWLIEQINSGLYPGLHWLNAERTRFQIPWKHRSRQDVSEDDFKIFEAWAIASGRYRPGIDVPDPIVWKRNFRSALNRKKHFHRVVDSRNSETPHLIYEIRSIGQQSGASAEEESEEVSPAIDSASPGLSTGSSPNVQGTLESSLQDMTLFDWESGGGGEGTMMEVGAALYPSDYAPDYAVAPNYLSQIDPSGQPTAGADAACAMPLAVEDPDMVIPNVGEFQTQMRGYFQNGHLATEFEITIYYRGKRVKEQTLKNINGFRLFYTSESKFPYLEDLQFPEAASCLSDQQQIMYTNKLLEGMGQGLTVEVKNNQICAQRHGSCRTFWSMTENPSNKDPRQISNRELTVLYDLPQFHQELCAFLNSERGSPQYSIWLCFGELWPDCYRPWNKKMIMVQVTPITFKLLHELAHGVGASSLNSESINLQLSDPLSSSSLLSILEQCMDVEYTDSTSDDHCGDKRE
ncbi:interferon regulatory factor 3-like [Hemiscyllium ocellatum]|uniref:interferon regulatory factor 3-like n=1 Tax=Hemiscyllium ocellatum TaxID=170820 RepID=UPI002966E59D|nr:interferon regulatory factor 3-like [Hemiscyllium ocellatum]XP_060705582.1 interferon regulatory factor 3-like [Hemiscyllium ocellatum]